MDIRMRLPTLLIGLSLAAGCGDDPPVATPATTSGMGTSTSTGDPPVDTTMQDSTGSMLESTGPESTSSGTTSVEVTSSTTVAESSSSTGEPGGPCVDVNIGSELGNGVASGSTAGSGNDFHLEDCDIGAEPFPGPDFVVEWTAPRSGMYMFTVVDSDFDTVMGVFPASCDDAAVLECNDDCESFTSAVGYTAQAGETVFIVIEGYWGTDGHFSLDIYDGVEPDCCSDETWGGYCGGTWGTSWGSSFWGSSSGWWETETDWSGTDTEWNSSGFADTGGFIGDSSTG